MSTSQRLIEAELDAQIASTQECRCPRDLNQGRGPNPKRASLWDWLLAVVIGTSLYFALVAWSEEPNPTYMEASK